MIRPVLIFAACFSLAACGKSDDAPEPAAAAAPATGSAPAPAAASMDFAKVAAGTRLEVTRQTQCREVDASKGAPWDLAPGVSVKYLALEGAEARVETAMTQCMVPADALKLSQ